MPSVTPETRLATPAQANNAQDLSQASAPQATNSLRNYAQIAALSMALTNSEPALAQNAIAPNPPAGHPAYVPVQRPDGTVVQVPVVSSIPQGYAVAQAGQLPTYQAQQPVIQRGNLPVYTPASVPTQPVAQPAQGPSAAGAPGTVTYAGQVPMAPGAQGVAPQGGAQVVSYGPGAPSAGGQTVQTAPSSTTLEPSATIPHSLLNAQNGIVNVQNGNVQVPSVASNVRDPRINELRNEAEVRRLEGQIQLNDLRQQETIENIQRRRVLNNARNAETLEDIARRKAQKDYNEGVQRTGSWVGGEIFRRIRAK